MQEILESLRTEWKTKKAIACADIAAKLIEQASILERVTEARHWLREARAFDNEELANRLKALEEDKAKKARGRGAANRLKDRKKAAGDNVVDFPAKDGI